MAYSARGSHANYATPGTHYYAIPLHLLADHTDKGHLWDPAKNSFLYHYDPATDVLTPDPANRRAPTGWFHYDGKWGDRAYPLSDQRQYRVVGQVCSRVLSLSLSLSSSALPCPALPCPILCLEWPS